MSLYNWVYNRLFNIKLMYRNIKAKPVRRKQAEQGIRMLETVENTQKRIFFCGIPIHKNLGDQGQRYCIERWCKENYPDYTVVPIATWAFYEKNFKKKLEGLASKDDIFLIQSGYCTTSRHYDHPMHRYVVSTFVDNAILIMPQTVRFVEDRDGHKTGKIYDAHKKLMFLARDKISFESAKKFFPHTKVYLYPDIVTTLIGTMEFKEERKGVLICVRNDGEKKYGSDQIEELSRRFLNNGTACDISDTNSDLPLEEIVARYEEVLSDMLRFFASHRVVITDRFHGTIFSLISNTPVIVLETNDHKVKTGTEWFAGVYDGAYYNAGSIEEAYKMAGDILNSNTNVRNSAYFKEKYFDVLKNEFEKVRNSDG